MISPVVLALRQLKAALLVREDAAMREMARRWLQVERNLSNEFVLLATELADLAAVGQAPTTAQLWQLSRYRSLLTQTTAEFEQYAAWATPQIAAEQAALGALAITHAEQAIQLSFFEYGMGRTAFNRLPVTALEHHFGLSSTGAPVGELLRTRMVMAPDGTPLPGVWERLVKTLQDGVTLGRNPRLTAELLAGDLTGGLQKAMTIARSEQMRVYRLANAEAYQTSGVVREHLRLTAHNMRVCAACLADEGTAYPLSKSIPDHPNGCCTGVPVLIGKPAPQWTKGEAWLQTQDYAIQESILGPGRCQAWLDNEFDFADLARHSIDPTWGPTLNVTSLKTLIGD